MQCEDVRRQFADYVIDQIEEPLRSEVTQHLAACTDCSAEAGDMKTLWTALGSIPGAEPGPELRQRFAIMLEAYKHGLDQAPQKSWWHGMNRWLSGLWPRQPALQLGFSLALLILGVIVGGQFQTGSINPGVQPNTEVTELRNELSEMRQMVALSLMQQQSASDRLQGVNWSYQLQEPGGEVLSALLDALMHDSSINVRLATVDALRQFGDRPIVRRGVVEAMGREDSPMVQLALIDLTVDLRQKESIGALRRLTADQNVTVAVRDRAQRGIEELE